MGEYAAPLLVAAAALGLTYVFCLRPMRRHATGASRASCAPSQADTAGTHEIAALRQEIEALRRFMDSPAEARPSPATGQADITN